MTHDKKQSKDGDEDYHRLSAGRDGEDQSPWRLAISTTMTHDKKQSKDGDEDYRTSLSLWTLQLPHYKQEIAC